MNHVFVVPDRGKDKAGWVAILKEVCMAVAEGEFDLQVFTTDPAEAKFAVLGACLQVEDPENLAKQLQAKNPGAVMASMLLDAQVQFILRVEANGDQDLN